MRHISGRGFLLADRPSFFSLMDGQMPRLSGYDATAQIRQMQDPVKSKIKIIAFTASAFEGDKERCLAAGMDDYLTKVRRRLAMAEQTH